MKLRQTTVWEGLRGRKQGHAIVAAYRPANSPAVRSSLQIRGRSAFPRSWRSSQSALKENLQMGTRKALIGKPPARAVKVPSPSSCGESIDGFGRSPIHPRRINSGAARQPPSLAAHRPYTSFPGIRRPSCEHFSGTVLFGANETIAERLVDSRNLTAFTSRYLEQTILWHFRTYLKEKSKCPWRC